MSAVEDTADGPNEVLQVLFALHPSFGAQELCGPLEVLSNAHHKIKDPSTSPPISTNHSLGQIAATNSPQTPKPSKAPSPPPPKA